MGRASVHPGLVQLDDVVRHQRGGHIAALAEAPPRGLQIGALLQPIPITGFSMARGRLETALAISPFRFGSQSNFAAGIAMVTTAPDAVRLHDEMAERLWEAVKGETAGRLLRRAVGQAG